MRRSEVDKRAKRYAQRQCVADYGMHKDGPKQREQEPRVYLFAPATGQTVWSKQRTSDNG